MWHDRTVTAEGRNRNSPLITAAGQNSSHAEQRSARAGTCNDVALLGVIFRFLPYLVALTDAMVSASGGKELPAGV